MIWTMILNTDEVNNRLMRYINKNNDPYINMTKFFFK